MSVTYIKNKSKHMIQLRYTEQAIARWAEAFRERYHDNNVQAGYDPARPLQTDIRFRVHNNSGNFEIEFNLPEYWWYAEHGRGPGKMPPKGSLLQWMKFKQILPSPMQLKSGKTVLPSMDSLEFLIRRKIGEKGTKGSHTWELTESQMKDRLIQDVKEALTKDFTTYLESLR